MGTHGKKSVNYQLFYQRETESRDRAFTETRCLWCDDWSYCGTAEDGRNEALAHRMKKHPGIKSTYNRRRRPNAGRLSQSGMSKEEIDEVQGTRRKRMFLLGIAEEE